MQLPYLSTRWKAGVPGRPQRQAWLKNGLRISKHRNTIRTGWKLTVANTPGRPQRQAWQKNMTKPTRGLPDFPLLRCGWPQKEVRSTSRITSWSGQLDLPHAPTLVHRGACHRNAKDRICTRPAVHTLGSRPKCVG